jgi:hypothetical protein
VEGIMEQASSWVVAMEMLLWKVMAMVSWDIVHPVWVSFKERNVLPEFLLLSHSIRQETLLT